MALNQESRRASPNPPDTARSYLWIPSLRDATAALDFISNQHRLVTAQTLVPLPSYGIDSSSTTDMKTYFDPRVPDYCLSLIRDFF